MPVIYIFTFINVELFFLSIPIPDFIPSDRSVKTFVDFIGFSPVRKNKIFCFSFAYSKNSLNGGTPYCAKNFTLRFCQTPPDLETINFNETEVFRSLVVKLVSKSMPYRKLF